MTRGSRSRTAGRFGAPLLLSLPAFLFHAIPQWFQYDRAAIAAGQAWRLLTCHWTHWSLDHLIWDVVAFVVLLGLGWSTNPRRVLLTLGLAAAAIPLAVGIAMPGMQLYRGLSGLDSALFTVVAIPLMREEQAAGRRGTARLIALVLAGFALKIVLEATIGATLFADSTQFVPVPLAHVVGGLCGWIGTRFYQVARSSNPNSNQARLLTPKVRHGVNRP